MAQSGSKPFGALFHSQRQDMTDLQHTNRSKVLEQTIYMFHNDLIFFKIFYNVLQNTLFFISRY